MHQCSRFVQLSVTGSKFFIRIRNIKILRLTSRNTIYKKIFGGLNSLDLLQDFKAVDYIPVGFPADSVSLPSDSQIKKRIQRHVFSL